MKYNSKNKPFVCMQTQSTCYKETSTMVIKGVLWHSTGANNSNLKRYIQPSDIKPDADTYSKTEWLQLLGTNKYRNDWNHTKRQAGVNCWIGKLASGIVTAIQTMPWDFRPWGCGKGKKGSCNDGWIQLEIAEDNLKDKEYFNNIYKEACEITAYLCQKYNIDPKGTVTHNRIEVPTILCHKDSFNIGLGSNHKDIYHWFSKYDKDMTTVRNDVAKLIAKAATKTYEVTTSINKYKTAADAKAQKNASITKLPKGTYYIYNKYPKGVDGMYNISTDKTGTSAGSWINPKENVINTIYRVRKNKNNAKSQIGAYASLANAKAACKKAGAGYNVFDSNWEIVYTQT